MRRGAALAIVLVVSSALALLPWATWWRARALRATPRPLDMLLVTLDTTRADRLGCYAHVPLTSPSHASILTGVIPPRHGVRDNGAFVLGPERRRSPSSAWSRYRTGGRRLVRARSPLRSGASRWASTPSQRTTTSSTRLHSTCRCCSASPATCRPAAWPSALEQPSAPGSHAGRRPGWSRVVALLLKFSTRTGTYQHFV
jgi:hypothetical protein